MDSSSQNTAASETPAAATGAVAHPESPALDVSDTVLVVDDEPMIVDLLTKPPARSVFLALMKLLRGYAHKGIACP